MSAKIVGKSTSTKNRWKNYQKKLTKNYNYPFATTSGLILAIGRDIPAPSTLRITSLINQKKEKLIVYMPYMIMKKFEFVDITTADTAFVAYGKNLDELFANAALAMFEVMVDTKQVELKVTKNVVIDGIDLQSLLFNWLNKLLVFVDAENLVLSEFDVKVDEKNLKLKAVCKGEKIDRKKHETRTHVKAATYHKMRIENKNGWEAQVILDI